LTIAFTTALQVEGLGHGRKGPTIKLIIGLPTLVYGTVELYLALT